MSSFLSRRWRALAGAGAVAILGVALAVGLLAGGGRQTASPGAGATLARTGPPFPSLSGTDPVSGAKVGTAALDGRPYVVNLWASWCEGCQAEPSDIARFTRNHPEVGFLGVDVSDRAGPARRFAARFGWRHRSIGDPDGAIAGRLGVPGLPATVDAKGRVRGEVLGPVSYRALVDAARRIGT